MAVDRERRIGLVGCVKQKRRTASPARDFYTSPLFEGRRRCVEQTCRSWYVLSAKHGLVRPETVLDPYDERLKDRTAPERRAWSTLVLQQLAEETGPIGGFEFEVHAGAEYRNFGLVAGLESAGASVVVIGEHLGIGHSWRCTPVVRQPTLCRSLVLPATAKSGSYVPLSNHLSSVAGDLCTLTFAEIEGLLDRSLPNSARIHPAWWANGSHSHAVAWLAVGWRVTQASLDRERVTFARSPT